MTTRPAFSPDWREGRYFDRWMFVHLLAGVAGGFANRFFAFTDATVLLLGLGLMLLWEIAEVVTGVDESFSNRVLDLVVGGVGVVLALAIDGLLTPRGLTWAFYASGTLAAIGAFRGWLAYRRREAAT